MIYVVDDNLVIDALEDREYFARDHGRYLAAVVEIAPRVYRDLVTSIVWRDGKEYIPIQDFLTKRRRKPYVLMLSPRTRQLYGLDAEGRLWSRGATVRGIDLRSFELVLEDGQTFSLENLSQHFRELPDMQPVAYPSSWPLAHLLSVLESPKDTLQHESAVCPKCGGEGESVLFYPKRTALCKPCNLIWRLPEPRTLPDYDRVREQLWQLLTSQDEGGDV